ncbi:hypothetical protein DXG01_016037 [Tephrocybe rancida]|nr:hypothetical protein DXG01_016037 [Tephrocybe rancida]
MLAVDPDRWDRIESIGNANVHHSRLHWFPAHQPKFELLVEKLLRDVYSCNPKCFLKPLPLLMHQDDEHSANERTALLAGSPRPRKPKPLPWFQVSIVLLIQICEPITSTSIYPYINQLVFEYGITDGDERKVGYYAGLIESLFFVTEAITVLQWSRISDHIGRKPIMLIGLFGTALSILSFGLSRTFWALVISRCLCGLLNGNSGVMKSVMGELTDPSNRAQGFSLMPAVWATGATLGPLFGGTLAKPAENFPRLFGGAFWKAFPYFLPCVATSGFVFITFLITAVFFKETAPKRTKRPLSISSDTSYETLVDSSDSQTPLPLRKLLVYPVLLSIANYMALAFLDVAYIALLPLFLSMPLDIGGLGFTPATIGYIMGAYGCFTGLLHAFTFAKIVRYVGERRLFIFSLSTFLPLFMLPPIMSISAERFGVNWFTWVCIGIMIVLLAFMVMGFGCIFMFVTSSSPNKHSLGATNGLAQTTVSFSRAAGPAMVTSLFSLSVEDNLLGGYGVYVLFFVLSCLALRLASCLPHEMWPEDSSDDE